LLRLREGIERREEATAGIGVKTERGIAIMAESLL